MDTVQQALFFAFLFVSFTKLTCLSCTVRIIIFIMRWCYNFHFLPEKSHCIKCDNSVDSATTPHQLSEGVTKNAEDDLWTEGRRRIWHIRTTIHNPHCCALCSIRRLEQRKRSRNEVYSMGNNPYHSISWRGGKASLGWRLHLTHFQCKNDSQKTTAALYSCIRHCLTSACPKKCNSSFGFCSELTIFTQTVESESTKHLKPFQDVAGIMEERGLYTVPWTGSRDIIHRFTQADKQTEGVNSVYDITSFQICHLYNP